MAIKVEVYTLRHLSLIFAVALLACTWPSTTCAVNTSTHIRPANTTRCCQWFASTETLSYSENTTLNAWLNEFKAANTSSGQYALARHFTETGFSWKNFSLAGYFRREYFFHFTDDTFELVYRDKNRLAFNTNKTYAIALEVAHIATKGVTIGYTFSPINAFNTRIEYNHFSADELLFGSLNGYIGQSSGKIEGDLQLDYNYTKDVFLDRPITAPAQGKGHSVDIEFWWQPLPNLNTHLKLDDLYSAISWENAPFTQATITTIRQTTDAKGQTKRLPTLSGTEFFRHITQKIPRHQRADIHYNFINNLSASLTQERIESKAFNRINALYQISPKLQLGAGYDFTAKANQFEVRSLEAQLSFSADSIHPKKAKFIQFNAGFRRAF